MVQGKGEGWVLNRGPEHSGLQGSAGLGCPRKEVLCASQDKMDTSNDVLLREASVVKTWGLWESKM